MSFKKLHQDNIEAALSASNRQYLVGHLQKPQLLHHIENQDIEFGISSYTEATWEPAHSHTQAREFQYMLRGMTEYVDLITGEVHRFSTGDFYVIDPGTKYLQRIKRDTRILFVKLPAGNDKVEEHPSEELLEWAKQKLLVERLDLQGQDAPPANSLVPATAAAILDTAGRLLLIHRRDSGKWAMPGGTMEMNESLEDCIRREVLEETGLSIAIDGIVGTYTDPLNRVAYTDGEVRREFTILFLAHPEEGALAIDDESTDARWVPFDLLDGLPIAASQRRRLKDVIQHIETRRVIIR